MQALPRARAQLPCQGVVLALVPFWPVSRDLLLPL